LTPNYLGLTAPDGANNPPTWMASECFTCNPRPGRAGWGSRAGLAHRGWDRLNSLHPPLGSRRRADASVGHSRRWNRPWLLSRGTRARPEAEDPNRVRPKATI